MKRNKFYLLAIFCLAVAAVLGTKDGQARAKPRNKRQHDAQSSTKADVPTAEQILGKLLGAKLKTPEQTGASQAIATAPQSIPFIPPQPPLSTSQARSPLKTIFNNLPLIPSRGATPQTEDYADGQQPVSLPPPPPGYHYGRPRRKRPRGRYDDDDEEFHKEDGNDDEEEEPEDEEENPADEEYQDQRNLLGTGRSRGRGRGLGRNIGRRRGGGGCGCICWKGIKGHVQWVRVPVCYKPCGVCCPKHEEQPSCACICNPCCHCCHCCHQCCCHHPCHCCHSCHCCRRSATWRPPLAPTKQNAPKSRKHIKKTRKSKKKL